MLPRKENLYCNEARQRGSQAEVEESEQTELLPNAGITENGRRRVVLRGNKTIVEKRRDTHEARVGAHGATRLMRSLAHARCFQMCVILVQTRRLLPLRVMDSHGYKIRGSDKFTAARYTHPFRTVITRRREDEDTGCRDASASATKRLMARARAIIGTAISRRILGAEVNGLSIRLPHRHAPRA